MNNMNVNQLFLKTYSISNENKNFYFAKLTGQFMMVVEDL